MSGEAQSTWDKVEAWIAPYSVIERTLIVVWVAYALITYGLGDAPSPYNFYFICPATALAMIVVPRLLLPMGGLAVDLGRMVMIGWTCFASYEWAAMVLRVLPQRSYELTMLKLDHAVFGGNPSVWVQALHHPWLSEYFQIIYIAYFPTLLIVALALVVQRKREVFLHYGLALIAAVIYNHIAYILVPVQSPFLVADTAPYSQYIHYDFELVGVHYFSTIRQNLLNATHMRYDCFPSGHTMHSCIAIYFAWKSSRALGAFITWVGGSIIVSTLYLRYHYGVDLLVGGLSAAFWIAAAGWLLKGYLDPSEAPRTQVSGVANLARSERAGS